LYWRPQFRASWKALLSDLFGFASVLTPSSSPVNDKGNTRGAQPPPSPIIDNSSQKLNKLDLTFLDLNPKAQNFNAIERSE
jgi:hypothetical protein